MVKLPELGEMLKAGVHFGHKTSRWHPKMAPFLFGSRNGVHIIDLEKTQEKLTASLEYIKTLVGQGKVILFVGTKRQAAPIIKESAMSCGMPYVTERWIGGLITNFNEVKTRLKRYRLLRDQVASGEIEKYTKKEQGKFKKELEKMDKYLSGLITLDKMPDALYVADMRTEKTALAEALRKNVPVVGVCDSNVNPGKVACAIPANDDAVNSIKMVADLIAQAVGEGKAEHEKAMAKVVKEVEVKKVERVEKQHAFKKEESV